MKIKADYTLLRDLTARALQDMKPGDKTNQFIHDWSAKLLELFDVPENLVEQVTAEVFMIFKEHHKPRFTTPDIHAVKPGSLVTFVYGPGDSPQPEFAQHKGRAYGVRKSRFGDELRVKMDDFTFHTISRFTTVGIGAYLPA